MARQRITARLGMAKTAAAGKTKAKAKEEAPARNLSGFEYDPSKAKHLKRALHNINVSLGTLLAAVKDLALLRGSDVTPDGMLGGRGFVMPFREIKTRITESIGSLSDITDTIADELTNPKWGLSTKARASVKKEKAQIEERVDEVEDTAEGLEAKAKPNKSTGDGEEKKESEVRKRLEQQRDEVPPEIDEIKPSDVVDSTDALALARYGDLIRGGATDKVAAGLGKSIMANLLRGE